MRRASEIIVLCEDHLQEVFVRRFLKRGWHIKEPPIRVIRCSRGGSGGAGEKHVRDNYPKELKAFRTRRVGTILIVVMDADAGTVSEHHRELEKTCSSTQPPICVRQPKEAVVHVISKWHIETWLAYLDGVSVTEDQQYKSNYAFRRCEAKCHPLVDKLATACKNGEQLPKMPDSLVQACKEFERIRHLL